MTAPNTRPSASFRHGTASGYNRHRCRCAECREFHRVNRIKVVRERSARTAANGGVAPVKKHNRSTYQNWGCRCEACREANAQASQEIRDRRTAVSGAACGW